MIILGIETSCDETSIAVVENGTRVLSNVIFSQIKMHAKTGGVVPEVAAREHVIKIIPVFEETLKKANLSLKDIDAVAVTQGPGLLSSLLTGAVTANTAALFLNKPLIPVNHIHGHIYANWLEREEPKFPILILTVSGGHNEIFLMKGHGDIKTIGETVDDAAGEAFDKVAKLLGLPYPGGPAIMKAAVNGNPKAHRFPRAMMQPGNLDFSFSGIKTSVLYYLESERRKGGKTSEQFVNDVAASFQEAVVDALCLKLMRAVEKYKSIREIHLAGGVSANTVLRKTIEEAVNSFNKKSGKNIIFKCPAKFEYCTDNAAMIASAGYFNYIQNPRKFKNSYAEASAEF